MSTKNIKLSEEQAERLSSRIKSLGLSQGKAAELSNISAGYLSGILNLKKEPSQRTFSDICRALSISESFVFTGKTEMVCEKIPCFEVTSSMSQKKRDAILKINQMLIEMDDDGCASACLSVQEKKLLQDLLRQKESDKKAG